MVNLSHSGRLGNQLWNVAAVYAYCRERGYEYHDYASFDYRRYFLLPPLPHPLMKLAWVLVFWMRRASNGSFVSGGRLSRVVYCFRTGLESSFTSLLTRIWPAAVVRPTREVFLLPPSKVIYPEDEAQLLAAESRESGLFYMDGWLFKNPVGLQRHGPQVRTYLSPRPDIHARVRAFLQPYRDKYSHVFGVHLRRTDYREWAEGRLFLTDSCVAGLLKEYLDVRGLHAWSALFIVCADEAFCRDEYCDLNVVAGPGSEIDDLLTLATCDVVLGSNSTFGAFAAYYGDVPHIILERDGVDWSTYARKSRFLDNPHFVMNTFAGYSIGDAWNSGYRGGEVT